MLPSSSPPLSGTPLPSRKPAPVSECRLTWDWTRQVVYRVGSDRRPADPARCLQDMAARRLSKFGKNDISPPPKNLAKRIYFYIFGGFGSLLVGGSAVCFISWK